MMQKNSLLECIEYCSGIYLVSGVETRLLPDIPVGTIVTAKYFKKENDIEGVILLEDNGAEHPVLKLKLGRVRKRFREIQPPMEVKIDELLTVKA